MAQLSRQIFLELPAFTEGALVSGRFVRHPIIGSIESFPELLESGELLITEMRFPNSLSVLFSLLCAVQGEVVNCKVERVT